MIESNFFGIDNGAAFLIGVYGFFIIGAYGLNLLAKWCDK